MTKILYVVLFALVLMFQNVTEAKAQTATVTINTKKDTVVKKNKLIKLEAKVDTLRAQVRLYKKYARKYFAEQFLQKEEERTLRMKNKERVYFVVCESDTATLKQNYGIDVSANWDNARASLDSLCRVMEHVVDKDKVKDYRKAYKDGVLKEFVVYPDINRLRNWLNDPANKFTEATQ